MLPLRAFSGGRLTDLGATRTSTTGLLGHGQAARDRDEVIEPQRLGSHRGPESLELLGDGVVDEVVTGDDRDLSRSSGRARSSSRNSRPLTRSIRRSKDVGVRTLLGGQGQAQTLE